MLHGRMRKCILFSFCYMSIAEIVKFGKAAITLANREIIAKTLAILAKTVYDLIYKSEISK